MRDIDGYDDEHHGGSRGAHWQDEEDLRWGGWSTADYITVGLLVVLLATVVAMLAYLTFGGGYCPPCEEVTAQGS